MKLIKILSLLIIVTTLIQCASYKAKYSNPQKKHAVTSSKKPVHTFYLIGDAGNANMGETLPSLNYFTKEIKSASKNSTTLFLGDNVYPVGIYPKNHPKYELSKYRLLLQANTVKEYKGKPIFIPGNHDWYNGIDGLKRQEKLVEKALGKNTFLPEGGCGLKKVSINEHVVLIVIDSEWYITNWDGKPKMNDNCDIKTREHFLEELSGYFKKNRDKNIVVALHHPLYSNGPHGSSFSVKDHLKPVPVLGTLKNIIRAHAGIQTDNFNKSYAQFVKEIEKIAEDFKSQTVFVSGHEHNLQYIEKNGFKQVVSGSGSKKSAALIGYGAQFTYGNSGYAKLHFYNDGSAVLAYYAANNKDENQLLFSKQIIKPKKVKVFDNFPEYNLHKQQITTTIYDSTETKVSKLHQLMWGKLNRDIYGEEITVPVLELDKVFGGLQPVRKGGGNQTNSLRLQNKKGKEYVLRSMQKDASRIMGGILKGTFLVDVVKDIFTMSHPYAAFVVPSMATAVNVYHTNPKLYYVPKQPALAEFNESFGGGLYLLEERPDGNREDINSFGNSKKIISTYDVLDKIRKNEKHYIDQKWVIRSRLFDMTIGDWDRHEDQWRWASFETADKKTMYRPIPRDRDQPFSRFDGIIIPIFKQFVPIVRNMQSLNNDIQNIEWYNNYARFFDAEFTNQLTLNDWLTEVSFIQKNLTDEVIEKSIKQLPKNIFDVNGQDIINKLKSRRDNLANIAKKYYKKQAKIVQVIGTDKDDKFVVKRIDDNQTSVQVYRLKKKKEIIIYDRIFKTHETKEIHLYGLNGDDEFNISGNVSKGITVRLIGGQNHDVYSDESTVNGWSKKTKIYDFISKKNTLKVGNETADLRTNSYYKNTYNHKDIQNNTTVVFPTIGSNPDDGLFLGANIEYTRHGFKKLPFSSQHNFTANFYSSTSGYDFEYSGEFTEVISNWSLLLKGKITSDNYSFNFFGWGNESKYNRDINLDFYRVKKEEVSFSSSLLKRFRGGSLIRATSTFEAIEIEDTPGRNINSFNNQPTNIFDTNYFIGAELFFNHNRVDNNSFPTKGMNFKLLGGAKMNLENSTRYFGYLQSSLAIYQNLIPNRSIVFASEIGTHVNFKNRFEIYHAASIGGDRNLRGFRQNRFTGTESFYHSNDIRYKLANFKIFIPVKFGVTTGFDYGKVWSPYSPYSDKWHHNYGGSVWLSGVDMFTANLSIFNSNEGSRIAFGFGFNF
ncbi:metallophosphoesterase [Tenacibaculum geojense]|uniref:Metallophosphoesterase n=1 Tax=Tenacibaculum geojense TaxID=915352 RepID=A0ABW3JQ09_9FLAO